MNYKTRLLNLSKKWYDSFENGDIEFETNKSIKFDITKVLIDAKLKLSGLDANEYELIKSEFIDFMQSASGCYEDLEILQELRPQLLNEGIFTEDDFTKYLIHAGGLAR